MEENHWNKNICTKTKDLGSRIKWEVFGFWLDKIVTAISRAEIKTFVGSQSRGQEIYLFTLSPVNWHTQTVTAHARDWQDSSLVITTHPSFCDLTQTKTMFIVVAKVNLTIFLSANFLLEPLQLDFTYLHPRTRKSISSQCLPPDNAWHKVKSPKAD